MNIKLDETHPEIWVDGEYVYFPKTLFKVLACLIRNKGKVCTFEILNEVMDYWDTGDSSRVREYVRAIRRRLKGTSVEGAIETIHGFGYRLNEKTD